MITASLIITAAGNSSRWNEGENTIKKEFVSLKNGKSVLLSSLECIYYPLESYIKKVCIVYRPCFLEETKNALNFCDLTQELKDKFIFVKGGSTRNESTKNAIEALKEFPSDFVITHDGARPFASAKLVKAVFEDALIYSSSIPCIPMRDSIKMAKNNFVISNVERASFMSVQTPEVFKKSILEEAYEKYYNENATDDSEAVFLLGSPVHITKGEISNIKITYKEDLL